MAQRHVVGHRAQRAGLPHGDVAALAGHRVLAQQQAAVGFAVHVLQHLALAAAAGALVHDGDDVVVGGDHLDRGAVGGDPALALADGEQHAVHALLGAGAGIQVEGVDLVAVGHAVVHHHLPAVAVGVAERRRQEDDGAWREAVFDVDAGQHPLQIGEGAGEERCVAGGDQQRVVAELAAAGDERQGDQLLLSEPAQDLRAQRRERGIEAVDEARLLRRPLVGHHHAIGIAPPHVGLDVVHRHPVAAAGHHRLHDPAVARYVVRHLELHLPVGLAERQLQELTAAAWHQHLGRCLQRRHDIGRQPHAPPRRQLGGGRRPHQRFGRSHG